MKRNIKITAVAKGSLSVTLTANLKIEGRTLDEASTLKERITDELHTALAQRFHTSQIKIR